MRQPGGSAQSRDYAETCRQRGGRALPRLHPRRRVAGAEGLRLVAGARAVSGGAGAQEQAARQTADERLHGVGASGAQEAGGPVSSSAQRGAQQDFGQTVAVGSESRPSIHLLLSVSEYVDRNVQRIKTLKQDYSEQIKDGGGQL